MINLLYLLYFVLLFLATIEDVKKREVYDYLNYFFTILILVYGALTSINNFDLTFFYVLGLCFIGFFIGFIFYYIGMWGGGDAKLMISIPALLFFYEQKFISNYINLNQGSFANVAALIIVFLAISFIAGGILAVSVVLYNYIKNYKKVSSFKNYEKLILVFTGFVFLALFFLMKSYKWLFLLILVEFFIWLTFVSKRVENLIFVKNKSIKNIVLGDWVVEDVVVENKVIYKKEDFRLGVDEKQLNKFKHYYQKGVLKSLKVKDGLPFYVGFLFSLVFFLF